MTYLFGDSSPSTLRANFLEFLRDALDFSVYVLLADTRIRRGRERMEALRRQAVVDLDQLDVFGKAVALTIAESPKGPADSPAQHCAVRLDGVAAECVRAYMVNVRERLAADIAQAEAAEAAERDGCHKALEALLAAHDPHEGTTATQIV